MKSGFLILGLAAALLAGCDRMPDPPPAPAAPATTVERPGLARWDAAAGAFEIGGQRLRTARLWTFDGSTDGFTGQGSQIIPAAPQGLAVSLADPTLRSPSGLAVPGKEFQLVLVRLTRTQAAAANGWSGNLYYTTPSHPEAADWFGLPLDNTDPKVGETVTFIYDMGRQLQGAPDWANSTIDQFRLDLEANAGGRFIIHQVAVAAAPAGSGLGAVEADPAGAVQAAAGAPGQAAPP
ncbi:hypothetical protein [Phenylobacterium sp. J367]|uniref:hypothetical protein n=1 Tax=Phenylobacterium sp. J367 TaxID=2898435 RepID=UPI002151D002|nr:hypothetical protein [Phenylobacterium sp. J367]MCR5879720.1 hypothetical protein [Phenylobacterium sp. J367]